jgi:hypothetical protein
VEVVAAVFPIPKPFIAMVRVQDFPRQYSEGQSCSLVTSETQQKTVGMVFEVWGWGNGSNPRSFIDGEKGLQPKFFASFALVTPLYNAVAFLRFFDSLGHFRGFVFHPEGFPVERRVGRPANVKMNAQVHEFYFVLSIRLCQ